MRGRGWPGGFVDGSGVCGRSPWGGWTAWLAVASRGSTGANPCAGWLQGDPRSRRPGRVGLSRGGTSPCDHSPRWGSAPLRPRVGWRRVCGQVPGWPAHDRGGGGFRSATPGPDGGQPRGRWSVVSSPRGPPRMTAGRPTRTPAAGRSPNTPSQPGGVVERRHIHV